MWSKYFGLNEKGKPKWGTESHLCIHGNLILKSLEISFTSFLDIILFLKALSVPRGVTLPPWDAPRTSHSTHKMQLDSVVPKKWTARDECVPLHHLWDQMPFDISKPLGVSLLPDNESWQSSPPHLTFYSLSFCPSFVLHRNKIIVQKEIPKDYLWNSIWVDKEGYVQISKEQKSTQLKLNDLCSHPHWRYELREVSFFFGSCFLHLLNWSDNNTAHLTALSCKVSKILCVNVVGVGDDYGSVTFLLPSVGPDGWLRGRILWKFHFVEQTPRHIAHANPMVIKLHSLNLTCKHKGQQNCIYELINKMQICNVNLVTGIGSWQMAMAPTFSTKFLIL